MQSFEELSQKFIKHFDIPHFPPQPSALYEPANYFLKLGGKRVRPVLCLMGNELFDDIKPDAWHVANAIELFHNFTLIHDDIMDKAPLRRGQETVHVKYGDSTALLAGDVMLVAAYEQLNRIDALYSKKIINVFSRTAREVCEGQQMDMQFEKQNGISMDDYVSMIGLKTSVLLAASLKLGAILGGAGERNQQLMYEFGKKLGIAFQIQDDYLDAFGDPKKFGKQTGGDIRVNKKTFLAVAASQHCTPQQKKELLLLERDQSDEKVNKVLEIFKTCKVDEHAKKLKDRFLDEALSHLDDIAVLSVRKSPLQALAQSLVKREY